MKKFTQIRVMLILLLVLSFFSSISYSQNQPRFWYVYKNATGSNNGTSWTNAWTSFSAIQWSSIQPGDFIYISGGTDSIVYPATLTVGATGAPGSPLTIIAGKYAPDNNGHSGRVIIDGNYSTTIDGIYIHGSTTTDRRDYIIVKGFEIRNVRRGIYAQRFIKGITIDSCVITNTFNSGSIFSEGDYTTYNNTGVMTADSLTIKNCYLRSSDTISTLQPDVIYVQRISRIYIYNNYIHQANKHSLSHNDGIQAYLAGGFVIFNNFIRRDSSYNPEAVFGSGDGGGSTIILGSQGSNPVIIFNNVFYHGGQWHSNMAYVGNFFLRWYSESTMPPTFAFNNTVITAGPLVRDVWGEYFGSFHNNIVAHWWRGSQTFTYGTTLAVPSSPVSYVDSIRSNIFVRDGSLSPGFTGTFTGNGNTGTPSDWSSWVNTYGGTGINADPLFIHNIGYEPDPMVITGEVQSNSPAIDAGEDLTHLINYLANTYNLPQDAIDAMTKDMRGISRPQGAGWDIGAYEYGGQDFGQDTISPRLLSATIIDSVTLNLTFSEPLEQYGATNPSNYNIDNGIAISNATLIGNNVRLNTSVHTPGFYTITVSNVTDTAGNPITNQNNSRVYGYNPDPLPNLIKFTPTISLASSIPEPDHLPEKTFDGLGYNSGDPTSRWAASGLPQWIVYDLGDTKIINKTRIQFFRALEGRIYTYSILVSADSVNWVTVKQNIQSANVEWNEENFGPIPGRYLKILVTGNNESDWANIWETEIYGQLMVNDNKDESEILPSEFKLFQNYPNPFNPTTKISWQSPVGSHQTLKVFDVLGNEVATLVDEYREAGKYKVEFNVGQNSSVSSGVYFYQLKAADYIETKKMILIR